MREKKSEHRSGEEIMTILGSFRNLRYSNSIFLSMFSQQQQWYQAPEGMGISLSISSHLLHVFFVCFFLICMVLIAGSLHLTLTQILMYTMQETTSPSAQWLALSPLSPKSFNCFKLFAPSGRRYQGRKSYSIPVLPVCKIPEFTQIQPPIYFQV